MRKTKAILAGLVICVAASSAVADLQVKLGGHNSVFNNGSVGGGWFQATRTGNLGNWDTAGVTADFKTFCIEDVVFSPGTTYYATIGDTVLNGPNMGGAYNGALLTDQTKKLYAGFLNGSLELAEGAITTAAQRGGLQAAFWALEGVTGYTNATYDGYKTAYIAWATAQAYVAGQNDVKVMNLWTNANGTGDVQSQLIKVDLGGDVVVPAPGAALLGFVGLGIVGWVKRRIA